MSIRQRRGFESQPNETPPRIPAPSYRHAAPSGPWPWMNIDSEPEADPEKPQSTRTPSKCLHTTSSCNGCWAEYPQSLFPNWTAAQVKRSGLKEKVPKSSKCVIRHVDVSNIGEFSKPKKHTLLEGRNDEFWDTMQVERPQDVRLRVLFVENLSVPVLQMLGTKYNIEPFFFTSSLNWIPSRYQEDLLPGQGDHITITLTFIRTMKVPVMTQDVQETQPPKSSKLTAMAFDHVIDTQAPLPLRSKGDSARKEDQILLLDLLAIHMIRTPNGSTIISYHPSHDRRAPPQPHESARRLHSRIGLAGQSVYWQNIFQKSQDPTFVLLTILWFALYAWDEALETLWEYICTLELSVISTNDMKFTQELHQIRAHLLHYSSLLDDFRRSVDFVLETENPVMERWDEAERRDSHELLKKECRNLMMEIDRLSMSRNMQDKRLKNVMNLVFSSVNIEDSKRMQDLTEAAVRDSRAMKQIAYLTMVFLPASFAAAVFGMNVKEINQQSSGTLGHYVATAVPFTVVTIWIIIAFQGKWNDEDSRTEISLWTRLSWPIIELGRLIGGRGNGRRRALARSFETQLETIGIHGKAMGHDSRDSLENGDTTRLTTPS